MNMPQWSASARSWLEGLHVRESPLFQRLRGACGGEDALTEERLGNYREALKRFVELFGPERPVGIVRAPGRLNTLGRHVDHRGGYVNPMALTQEVVLVFSGREDDLVDIVNLDRAYGRRTFRISDSRSPQPIKGTDAWLDWTQHLTQGRAREGTAQDWVHKLAAPTAYLSSFAFPDRELRGLTGVMTGNIPPRIGLSSSSAIVVAMMMAACAANGLAILPEELVRHCGIAEWYVGTRGGSGDHAAIVCARAGHLLKVRTVPELDIAGCVPFREDLRVIVFHSGYDADKTGAAGNTFNERTATYEMAEMFAGRYLREHHVSVWRELSRARRHLGNVKVVHLGDIAARLSPTDIYDLLASIPEHADRQALKMLLPDEEEALRRQFATHREPPGGYPLRAVLLFGIAECARSARGADLLRSGDVEGFGRLMNISHDGDRVSGGGWPASAESPLDTTLEVWEQPGGYACSTPEIDSMVDIARSAGALGAQVAGAGLGGSMMALVAAGGEETVTQAMTLKYFQPRGIKPNHLPAVPCAGAGLL